MNIVGRKTLNIWKYCPHNKTQKQTGCGGLGVERSLHKRRDSAGSILLVQMKGQFTFKN